MTRVKLTKRYKSISLISIINLYHIIVRRYYIVIQLLSNFTIRSSVRLISLRMFTISIDTV